jgi:hypothetical protein
MLFTAEGQRLSGAFSAIVAIIILAILYSRKASAFFK